MGDEQGSNSFRFIIIRIPQKNSRIRVCMSLVHIMVKPAFKTIMDRYHTVKSVSSRTSFSVMKG